MVNQLVTEGIVNLFISFALFMMVIKVHEKAAIIGSQTDLLGTLFAVMGATIILFTIFSVIRTVVSMHKKVKDDFLDDLGEDE